MGIGLGHYSSLSLCLVTGTTLGKPVHHVGIRLNSKSQTRLVKLFLGRLRLWAVLTLSLTALLLEKAGKKVLRICNCFSWKNV